MKKSKIFVTALATLMLANSVILPLNVNADSTKVVTLGADLSDTQKQTVLDFFNVNENEVVIITVDNQEERKYLEGIVADSIIGTHTLSCCYINPMEDGGIQVKTANLTWVTENMLANALATAGVDNCQVIATAPFEVSGTGALTGILKSYETASDVQLDEDKKAVATEELVISAELTDNNDEDDVLQFMNDVKSQVVSEEVPNEQIEEVITDTANDYNITLSDEQLSKINEWLTTLNSLDYNIEQFTNAINQLNDTIKNKLDGVQIDTTETKGFFARIWEAIKNFFISLFGGDKPKNDSSIFDDVNTDIFDFDNTIGDSDSTTENIEE